MARDFDSFFGKWITQSSRFRRGPNWAVISEITARDRDLSHARIDLNSAKRTSDVVGDYGIQGLARRRKHMAENPHSGNVFRDIITLFRDIITVFRETWERVPDLGNMFRNSGKAFRDSWERVSRPWKRVSEPWEDVSRHLGTCFGTLETRTPNPGSVFRVAKKWFRALGKRSRFAIRRFRVARS